MDIIGPFRRPILFARICHTLFHLPGHIQVTTIKDAAFGLGQHPRKNPSMAAAVVDLVASKPQHKGEASTTSSESMEHELDRR